MSDKQVITDAFTELAPRYEGVVDKELKRFWGWGYDDFVDNMIEMMPLQTAQKILDVATGTAVIPLKLIQRDISAEQVVGLDITLAMLQKASRKIASQGNSAQKPEHTPIRLSCASAMAMPYRDSHFDVIFCALATHHLDVPVVLDEMFRVLKAGGRIIIADAMGSTTWRLPGINALIRAATFVYFLPQEGYARARAEASALSNVYNENEWDQNLTRAGFDDIKINNLPSSHSWLPSPLVIQAQKL